MQLRQPDDKILNARIRLVMQYPYLAEALLCLPLIEDTGGLLQMPTMATDGRRIYYHPRFVAEHSEEDLMFVLAHELMHCVLGHIERGRSHDRLLWNLAIDYATNAFLLDAGFRGIDGMLHDVKFRGLAAEEIYLHLATGTPPDVHQCLPLDVHLEPGEGEPSDQQEKAAKAGSPKDHELRRIRRNLVKELLEDRESWGRSMKDNPEVALLAPVEEPSVVDWRQMLSQFMLHRTNSEYSLFPPNKKHVWRDMYLPSVHGAAANLLLAVDTSGSMEADLLARVFNEIEGLRSSVPGRLTLIQCDMAIRSVVELEAWDSLAGQEGGITLRGRGGTDFRPVFEWVGERFRSGTADLDAVLYITDGMGTFPDAFDDLPVLWLLTRECRHRGSPQFGQVALLWEDGANPAHLRDRTSRRAPQRAGPRSGSPRPKGPPWGGAQQVGPRPPRHR